MFDALLGCLRAKGTGVFALGFEDSTCVPLRVSILVVIRLSLITTLSSVSSANGCNPEKVPRASRILLLLAVGLKGRLLVAVGLSFFEDGRDFTVGSGFEIVGLTTVCDATVVA